MVERRERDGGAKQVVVMLAAARTRVIVSMSRIWVLEKTVERWNTR